MLCVYIYIYIYICVCVCVCVPINRDTEDFSSLADKEAVLTTFTCHVEKLELQMLSHSFPCLLITVSRNLENFQHLKEVLKLTVMILTL